MTSVPNALQALIDLRGGGRARAAVDLGHQERALAVAVAQRAAHPDLAGAVVVVPAVVHEGDAVIDRGADDARRGRLVAKADVKAAQPQQRDLDAGAPQPARRHLAARRQLDVPGRGAPGCGVFGTSAASAAPLTPMAAPAATPAPIAMMSLRRVCRGMELSFAAKRKSLRRKVGLPTRLVKTPASLASTARSAPTAARPRRDPSPTAARRRLGRVGGDGGRDVGVLAVDAAHAVELRAGRAPDAGGGALLCVL